MKGDLNVGERLIDSPYKLNMGGRQLGKTKTIYEMIDKMSRDIDARILKSLQKCCGVEASYFAGKHLLPFSRKNIQNGFEIYDKERLLIRVETKMIDETNFGGVIEEVWRDDK